MPKQEKEKEVLTFEEAVAQLEIIVRKLESGEAPLEESLALFERGVALTAQCNEMLNSAQQKVQVLIQKGDEVVVEDFKPKE